jgi:hypothetical protein
MLWLKGKDRLTSSAEAAPGQGPDPERVVCLERDRATRKVLRAGRACQMACMPGDMLEHRHVGADMASILHAGAGMRVGNMHIATRQQSAGIRVRNLQRATRKQGKHQCRNGQHAGMRARNMDGATEKQGKYECTHMHVKASAVGRATPRRQDPR